MEIKDYITIEVSDGNYKPAYHNLLPTPSNVANFLVQQKPEHSVLIIPHPIISEVMYRLRGTTVTNVSDGARKLPDLQKEIDRLLAMDPADLPEVEFWDGPCV